MARLGGHRARLAIAPSTLPDGAPMSGHVRVWSSVRSELETLGVYDHSENPDVWFFSAHGGPPQCTGRSVAVAYEAGWTVPGAYVGYPDAYLTAIDEATRQAVNHADTVVVGAESARGELLNAYGLNPDRVHVVPFGVDLDAFHPRHAALAATLPEFADLLDRPIIAFVNSLAPRKNVGLVRAAVERLLHEGYPHRLVMVGSAAAHLGGDIRAIEERAFAPFPGYEGRVVRLTSMSDSALSALMATASVLCAPSSHEGFGLTPLEAMASGTPVVAARRGALTEVVGNGGVLVEPTVDAVVDGLREVLDGDEREWRDRARRRAEQFPWAETAKGWADVADKVSPHQRPRSWWRRTSGDR